VEIGLRNLQMIGLEVIAERVRCLTGWLLDELSALRHNNGRAMVRIYGPATTEHRSGTVTFNLYDPQGHLLDYRRVEELAGEEGISPRTGCFCNPGAGEMAEGLTEEDMQAGLSMGPEINRLNFVRLMHDRSRKSASSIRASMGLATNFLDVLRFLRFIAVFRDQTRLIIGDVTFDIESRRIIRDRS
jgi:molybdenum cofactor sulfurtransferase